MSTPVELRAPAAADADVAVRYCVTVGGTQLSGRFIADLDVALAYLSINPMSGSPHWSYEVGVQGLRHWRWENYPCLVVYLCRNERVDVLRVPHARRDIPAVLQRIL